MATEIDKTGEGTHRHEQPSDWGWHAEFPRLAQFAGVVSALSLIVMVTATHYNDSGTVWLLLFAVLILVGIGVSRHFQKTGYRGGRRK